MTYHSLSDSGMTPEERRQEANVIIAIFNDCDALGRLSRNEYEFVEKMAKGFPVSTSQLFWLRDLKSKYCE